MTDDSLATLRLRPHNGAAGYARWLRSRSLRSRPANKRIEPTLASALRASAARGSSAAPLVRQAKIGVS